MIVGKTDSFERKYMEKFRSFASNYGEFVHYERDRGARDIGLHFIKPLPSRKEKVTASLCWFQMKGIMETTLSREKFDQNDEIKLHLKVEHLKFWFLQPNPTYLVIYIESKDLFLIMNIQSYIENVWSKNILLNKNKTISVSISKDSILDNQAFSLIIRNGEIEEWKKVLGGDTESIKICNRDYNLIWRIGKAEERKTSHRLIYWDWQTKTRSQWYIQEMSKGKWIDIREHWEFMADISDLNDRYPYLELYSNQNHEEDYWEEDEEELVPSYFFEDGTKIKGTNCHSEYYEYIFGIRLNEYGKQLLEFIEILEKTKLIYIDESATDLISTAPWHNRNV